MCRPATDLGDPRHARKRARNARWPVGATTLSKRSPVAATLRRGLHVDPELIAGRNLSLPQYSNSAAGPARYFPTEFVPIGTDGSGNDLVVDCRRGPKYGCLRDHDHEGRGTVQPPMFDSLADLLGQTIQSLHTGRPLELGGSAGGCLRTPTVNDGILSWD